MNIFGSKITPDPYIEPIPVWMRAPFWGLGALIAFGWMAQAGSRGDTISTALIFLEMFGVVFVAVLVAVPNILISLGGIILMIARQPARARRLFSYALRWNPGDQASYLNRGFASFQLGEYQDCIADMSRMLEVKPRHFHALFHRGTSYYMLEDHHNAMLDLSEAVQVKPQNIINRINLANTYLDSERYEEARQQYEIVLERKPKHFAALANIGASYSDEANFERAIEYYDRVLANFESPLVLCNRGEAHFLLGNETQAEADFARAFEKAPRSGVLSEDELRHKIRGQYRLLKGDIDGALDDLQKANEAMPSRKDTLAALAAAHLMSGHADAAQNFWNLLLERDVRYADPAFVQRRMHWPDTIMEQIRPLTDRR